MAPYRYIIKTIISNFVFFSPVKFTSFWITSEDYSAVGHDPMGDKFRGYKQRQENRLFPNVVIKHSCH